MNTLEIFDFLQQQIHTVIVATNDERGQAITCAIDLMDYDDSGLYFLTAKGKSFYKRLKSNGNLSLTGIKGESTMSCVSVSVRSKVKEIGSDRLQKLLEKNPYMYEIYPTEQSRMALTVFCLYEGHGEWFDLSKKPIGRFSFSFGLSCTQRDMYFITEKCIRCGHCLSACPQNCIDLGVKTVIRQENCLHCGNCMHVCPIKAIIRKESYETD